SMRLGAGGRRLTPEAQAEFDRQFGERISHVPGVKSQGSVTSLPFTSSVGWGSITVEGFTPQPGHELQDDLRGATPDSFRAMCSMLRNSRVWSGPDIAPQATRLVAIDEKCAQRFLWREAPL